MLKIYKMFLESEVKMSNKARQPQVLDLTKLNLMQLTQFKNQMDQDLQFYQVSILQ